MKNITIIIIGIAVAISFAAGWQTGTSTFYFTSGPNTISEKNHMFEPDISLSYSEYEELECLRLYKDITELSRTDAMVMAEQSSIDMHKNLLLQYIDIDCPNFSDLKFLSDNYGLNSHIPEFKPYTEKIIDAFKERYSGNGITEFPDSNGIPYKYSSQTGADLILEKDRVVLKVWKDDELLCIVSNPLPRDLWDNCPPKW